MKAHCLLLITNTAGSMLEFEKGAERMEKTQHLTISALLYIKTARSPQTWLQRFRASHSTEAVNLHRVTERDQPSLLHRQPDGSVFSSDGEPGAQPV